MIVADPYINIAIEGYTADQFRKWAKEIIGVGRELGGQYFNDLEFEYFVEEGSLKVRLRGRDLMMAIPVIWGMVASYPQFKEGVAEIAKDSVEFSCAFTEKVKEIVGVDDGTIYRRVRSRDVNRLSESVRAMDQIIERNLYRVDREEYETKKKEIFYYLSRISQERKNELIIGRFFNSVPRDKAPDFPKDVQEFYALIPRETNRFSEGRGVESALYAGMITPLESKEFRRVAYEHTRPGQKMSFRGTFTV